MGELSCSPIFCISDLCFGLTSVAREPSPAANDESLQAIRADGTGAGRLADLQDPYNNTAPAQVCAKNAKYWL